MAVQISGNDITVPRDGSFTRNVTIGGTLTYEDVTNIDSVGLVTARNGIEIGAKPGVAASISVDGNMIVSGITTFTPGGSEIVRINSGGLLVYNDVSFFGASTHAYWDHSASSFALSDNTKLKIGSSGSDLQIYHDGTNTTFDNDTGQFNLDGASGSAIRFLNNGTYQCQVGSAGLDFPDTKKIRMGDSEDLELQHDGTNNLIKTSTSAEIQINSGSEYMARFIPNGAVNLYYDNSLHFRTESGGAAVVDGNSSVSLRLEGSGGTCGYLTGDGSTVIGLSDNSGHYHVKGTKDGATELYHDNTLQCSTAADGLAFPSGKGINFNLTADATGSSVTAGSETFDDYEEGNFVVTVESGGTVSSFSHNRCSYTKIGRLVYFQLYLQINGSGNGNHFRLGNFPFTSMVYNDNGYGGAYIGYQNNVFQNSGDTLAYFSPNNTILNFWRSNGSQIAGNSGNIFGNKDMIIVGSYNAA